MVVAKMDDFVFNSVVLNDKASITKLTLGKENIPLLIIDDFAQNHHDLIDDAGDGSLFFADAKDYYPGKRKLTKASYAEQICSNYLSLFSSYFGHGQVKSAKAIASAFAISDQKPQHLRPMQMLPHFDTTNDNQLAVVHYLCDAKHGGTSFYRHRSSLFETITAERLVDYAKQLKKEAMANKIHQNPCYMKGSNNMFEQVYSVTAKMNRAIIYPSNALHSGNITPELGLSLEPQKGRLTIGSFIELIN
jgi:hypothetical protein